MPGIVGIITKKKKERAEEDLGLMISCMMHEPFYTSGKYVNDNIGLYAGWVCHEGSFSDCMPVTNENKDLILIFSGENFADKDVINHLKINGHVFNEENASYLLHLYEEDNDAFFKSLNGWFSGIIIDLREEKILVFNDRYGMERLYYYEDNEEIILSSEAKAILNIRKDLKQINIERLGEYFAYGCVLNNKTLFSKIKVLPSGSLWKMEKGGALKKKIYFTANDWEKQKEIDNEDFYFHLKTTFEKILPRYFNSGQQVGISLTGGLDTRAMLSYENIRSNNYPCYTFGGIYRDCHDVRIAKEIAELVGQTHCVLRLDESFFADFDSLAEKTIFISDGCHDLCGTHDLFFNKLARNIAPIRLTGKFGSEVLRGASTFKGLKLNRQLFNGEFYKYIEDAEKNYRERMLRKNLAFACFEEIPYHEHGKLTIEKSQLGFRTPYLDNDLIQLLFRRPKIQQDNKAITLNLTHDLNPKLLDIPTDLGFCSDQNIISKIVRLNRLFSFKAEWYFNQGMPHWLSCLTKLGLGKIEDHILGTHKIEHYRKWFKENLAAYMQNVLMDERTKRRPFFNGKFIDQMAERHVVGSGNFINEINKAITVELIYRQLIE